MRPSRVADRRCLAGADGSNSGHPKPAWRPVANGPAWGLRPLPCTRPAPPTDSPPSRRRTCASTPPTRWTGTPGATRRSGGRRDEQRPILLSVGYSACHWCHVMAHESFEDPQTAAADERALREREGGPRGAAGPGPDLPGRGAAHGRAGRLAAHRLPHPGRWCPSTAAPTSRPSRATACPPSGCCSRRSRRGLDRAAGPRCSRRPGSSSAGLAAARDLRARGAGDAGLAATT